MKPILLHSFSPPSARLPSRARPSSPLSSVLPQPTIVTLSFTFTSYYIGFVDRAIAGHFVGLNILNPQQGPAVGGQQIGVPCICRVAVDGVVLAQFDLLLQPART